MKPAAAPLAKLDHSIERATSSSNIVSRTRAVLGRFANLDIAVVAVCLLVLGALWTGVIAQAHFEHDETLDNAVKRNDNLVVAFEQYVIRIIDDADNAAKAVRREYATRPDPNYNKSLNDPAIPRGYSGWLRLRLDPVGIIKGVFRRIARKLA